MLIFVDATMIKLDGNSVRSNWGVRVYMLDIDMPNPVSYLSVIQPPTPHDLQSIRSRAPSPVSCHFAVLWLLEMLDVAGLLASPDEGLMACSSNHIRLFHNHNHLADLSPCDQYHLRAPPMGP